MSAVSSSQNSPSLSQLLSTLAPAAAIAAIYITAWILLRPRFPRIYSPRSFVNSLEDYEKTPELPRGLLSWIRPFHRIPDSYILHHHSLDAFLFLRYLRISVLICFIGCCLTWPILFPVNATGGGVQFQLNTISLSNVDGSNRYYAHAFVAWIYFTFVLYIIMRESVYYIHFRQAYLLSPLYADRLSSRTVLFTSVPYDYLDEYKLRKLLGPKVKNITIAEDCKKLTELVKKRDQIAIKLENAETKLVRMISKRQTKKMQASNTKSHPNVLNEKETGLEIPSIVSQSIRDLVPDEQRPHHRLKPLIGKKVDTIYWCRQELRRLIPEIRSLQEAYDCRKSRVICAAFVEFYTQKDAQAAFQEVTHHQPLQMAPKFIGVSPDEVIWQNLDIGWASRIIRNIIILAAISALIIFWAIPVAFVGTISNIKALASGDPTAHPPKPPTLPWLGFINKIPSQILGVVQGLLPSLLLSALMAILPVILSFCAKIRGSPSKAIVELQVQTSYFVFQVIQVFLVTTITSSASAVAVQIVQQPGRALTLLSSDLPKASNFYISYFILQGLAISSGAVLQLITLLLYRVLSTLLDSTPRKMYKRFSNLPGLGWGSTYPVYTLLTVIALTYSIIAPLVLGFATIGLYLIYLAYRYNLLFVFNAETDTKGLTYSTALQQTMTGIYLALGCLLGLFAVSKAWGPLVLIIILTVTTILFHLSLVSALGPLLVNLPRSLQAEDEVDDTEAAYANALSRQASNGNIYSKSVAPAFNDRLKLNTLARRAPAPPRIRLPKILSRLFDLQAPPDYETIRKQISQCASTSTSSPSSSADDISFGKTAYSHPAISSQVPTLWIPRDKLGVSKQECEETCPIIPMTDAMAFCDEHGKISWDEKTGKPPIWEQKAFL